MLFPSRENYAIVNAGNTADISFIASVRIFPLHLSGECGMLLWIETNDEVPMEQTNITKYPVDNASLLYLSLIRKNHTNAYRFTMTLTEDICPETLQQAVDRIYRRFPTVIAGFYPDFFHYRQIPAKSPPQVQPDSGILRTMSAKEIRECAYRVLYSGKTIAIEAFHALTDGYGAIASFTTLTAEYLRLKHGIRIPVENTLMDLDTPPSPDELSDSYPDYEAGSPMLIPSRFAYQLPAHAPSSDGLFRSQLAIPTERLLDAAHRHGVSMTALVSAVMADSVMEIQKQHLGSHRAKPVRIMVPVDLRRMFPSRTLRNFILYALPTLEAGDSEMPLEKKIRSFADQLRSQIEHSRLASIMAYNVRAQQNWLFRHIPLSFKCAFLRLGYRFFGESNSSVTVTNLGNVQLPSEMQPYVTGMEVILTPRVRSPYSCAMISLNGQVWINISRFSHEPELEKIFFQKLHSVVQK